MATKKLLQIPELFELILFNLPMRDLLLAQRVCRRWKDFILSSRRLQQRLFLLTPRACPQPEASANIEINPLLQQMFPEFFIHLDIPFWGTQDDPDGDLSRRHRRTMEYNRNIVLKNQQWYTDSATREAVLRPEASWRRMFPSHPPPRLGRFHSEHYGCQCGGGDVLKSHLNPKYEKFNCDPGARMGLIWDAVMFVMDDFPVGDFSVSWWRRMGKGEGEGKNWTLEMLVDSEHGWECYRASEAYEPSGFKISNHDDIMDYADYEDYMEMINEHEAPPVSVMRKYVRDAEAKIALAEGGNSDFAGNRDRTNEYTAKELYDLESILSSKLRRMAEMPPAPIREN
ncbi:hypothetical protein BJX64DRAFT_253794 [Aspergillus heterothallicus]